MPIPLPQNTNIYVEHKNFSTHYAMPTMEMATDHYNIGYTISGDRKCITPTGSYSYHSGDVSMMRPYVYGKTLSVSEQPYERILVKFSPEIIAPFLERFGQQNFDALYDKRVCRFPPEISKQIFILFRDMAAEYQKDTPYKEMVLQGMLFRLFAAVYENQLPEETTELSHTPLTEPVINALYYMENYYYKNPSLEETARQAGFSPAYFSRLFSAQLGKSYHTYLTDIKLRHVCRLLMQSGKSIMEIAQETGYCHGNYLCEQFRQKMGMTPSEYRKRQPTLSGTEQVNHPPVI